MNLFDEPITFADFKALKKDIRATRGFYTLQYIPMGAPRRNPKFPYLIGQDLLRMRVTVSGPRHWAMLCTRIPELAWVNRNSTISGDMFRIAKMHPGLVLRFGIDFTRYCGVIERKARERGIDIDNKPLVVYQWGQNAPDVDGRLDPVRSKSDYAEELREMGDSIDGEEEV